MEVKVGEAGSGKTSWLVKMMIEDDSLVLVAPTQRIAEIARRLSHEFSEGLAPNRFIAPASARSLVGYPGIQFVVDEAAHVPSFMQYDPVAITITGTAA